MPDTTLALGLAVDADQFNSMMGTAANRVDDLGNKAESAGKRGQGFIGGFLSMANPIGLASNAVGFLAPMIGDLGSTLIDAGKAAEADSEAMDHLGNILSNTASDYDGNIGKVGELVGQYENMGFVDDDVRTSLEKLTSATNSVGAAQTLLGTAADFATAKHLTLEEASGVLAKVQMGNVGVLERYGIAVDKGTTAVDALAMLQTETAGSAALFASSQEGAAQRTQNALANAQEAIGGAIMPALMGAVGGFADFLNGPIFQGGLSIVVSLLTNGLGGAFSFIMGIVGPLVTAAQPFVDLLVGMITGSTDLSTALNTLLGPMSGLTGPIMTLVDAGRQMIDAFSSGNLGQIGATFQSIAPVVFGALQEIGSSILTQIPIWVDSFITWIGPMIPPFLAELGSLASSVVGWIIDAAGMYVSNLAQWATVFITWIGPMIPPALEALGGFIASLVEGIAAGLPGFMAQLGVWAEQLIGWIAPQIPPLLAALGGFLGSLVNWAATVALPGILAKLGEWSQALISWIGPQIPGLLTNLGSFIGSAANWFITVGLPTIITKTGELAVALISWIVPQIPPFLTNLGSFIGSAANWFVTDALPTILTKTGELAVAIVGWVLPQIPIILGKLGEFGSTVWGWISSAATTAISKAGEIGSGIISGILDGLHRAANDVLSFMARLGLDAIDAAKKALGIGSPSTVAHNELGLNTGLGFAGGIDASTPAVVNAVEKQINAASGAMKGASVSLPGIGIGSGSISMASNGIGSTVVQVYIDGVLTDPTRVVVMSQELGFQQRNTSTGGR
jgi:hypothetical protein